MTLIELRIVVGIIAVLLSLVMPALRSAKDATKETLCATRQSELLKVTHMYNSDWGRYPPSLANTELPWVGWSRTDWLGAGHQGWEAHTAPGSGLYFQFLKTKGVYLCPFDRAESVLAAGTLTVREFSYSMNGRLGLAIPGRLRGIGDGDLPVFFEEDLTNNLNRFPEGCFTGTDEPSRRHRGRSNVGFADGHVAPTGYPPGTTAGSLYQALDLPEAPMVLKH